MSQTNYIEVTGKTKLEGIVNIPGAKNATLPMMCAALLTDEVCEFHNVPEISDIAFFLEVFEFLGAKIS
jgi:UDP-N-acetylglucosamine 1-carboxyvinyltransferase